MRWHPKSAITTGIATRLGTCSAAAEAEAWGRIVARYFALGALALRMSGKVHVLYSTLGIFIAFCVFPRKTLDTRIYGPPPLHGRELKRKNKPIRLRIAAPIAIRYLL